jgi:hypothetical protein
MAGESLQQNADRTMWSKKIACKKYRSHTLHLFRGRKRLIMYNCRFLVNKRKTYELIVRIIHTFKPKSSKSCEI